MGKTASLVLASRNLRCGTPGWASGNGAGISYNLRNSTNLPPIEVNYFEVHSVLRELGGRGSLSTEFRGGTLSDVRTSPSTGVQSGLLQRWYSIPNPGSYEEVLAQVFDPLFSENSEPPPDVAPFHAEPTWWTGNRQSIPGLPTYPVAIVGQPRSQDGGEWHSNDNDSYSVYLTGEILIPESGAYQFLDGIDNFAAFGIDLNRDGIVDELDDEFVINDNVWTDLNRDRNDGGLRDAVIPSVVFEDIPEGGEWFRTEVIVAEGGRR